MKIYTKTGDAGMTGLLGPGRFAKDGPRFEAYGTVDELNASIGIVRASGIDEPADRMLERVQNDLFGVGSALADPDPSGRFHGAISPDHVARLEVWIDELESELPPLQQFILPGGSPAGASLHLSRTICRRAERQVVRLGHHEGESVSTVVLIYLNRLSDFLFVLARAVNRRAGVADVAWTGL